MITKAFILFVLVNGEATRIGGFDIETECHKAGTYRTDNIAKYRDGVATLSYRCKPTILKDNT